MEMEVPFKVKLRTSKEKGNLKTKEKRYKGKNKFLSFVEP